jgi:hypothetical protein
MEEDGGLAGQTHALKSTVYAKPNGLAGEHLPEKSWEGGVLCFFREHRRGFYVLFRQKPSSPNMF